MKKCILIYLVAFLVVISTICHGEEEKQQDIQQIIYSIATTTQGVVLQTQDHYYLLTNLESVEQWKLLDNPQNIFPVLYGGYGILPDQGSIYQIEINNGMILFNPIIENNALLKEHISKSTDMAVTEHGVFATHLSDSSSFCILSFYSFEDEEITRQQIPNVNSLNKYDNNQVIVCVTNQDLKGYQFLIIDEKETKPSIWGSWVTENMMLPITGICYAQSQDFLYFIQGGRVYRSEKGMDPYIVGYTANDSILTACDMAVDLNGNYCMSTNHQLLSFGSSIEDEQILTIAGQMLSSDMNPVFEEKYPEVGIRVLWEEELTNNQLILDLMTNSEKMADIYILSISSDVFQSMREKGYCANLSSSTRLVNHTEKLYPNIQEHLYWEGQQIAIPYMLYTNHLFGVNRTLADQLEVLLPRTHEELINLYSSWPQFTQEEYESISLYYSLTGNLYGQLFRHVFDQYIALLPKNEKISFDTSSFRDILQLLDQEKSNLDILMDETGLKDDENNHLGSNTLFLDDYPLIASQDDYSPIRQSFSPLILSLSPEFEPIIPTNLYVVVINEASSKKELATQYLESLMDCYPAKERIMFYTFANEPIENENYQENVACYTERKAELEALRDNSSEENRLLITADIEEINFVLSELEGLRWFIAQEDIDRYEGIAPFIKIMTGKSYDYYCEQPNVEKLFHNYQYGLIKSDELIRQLNGVQMMINEE